METDLKIIKKMAAANEEETDAFLDSLKDSGLHSRSIDARLRRLLREIYDEFDCTTCAACCKEAYVVLETEDIGRLAKALDMKRSEFRARYVGRNEDGDTCFRRRPCPFLRNNLCTHYEDRPNCCREYPHSLVDGTKRKLDNLSANYLVCPMIFHALERFRESLEGEDRQSEAAASDGGSAG